MRKTFVTFGQVHVHSVNGITFDKDCIAVVNGDREKVFEIFGPQFCFEYPEASWETMGMAEKMHYFPRGYIEVDNG
jgi:hypothetical protein